MRYDDKSPYPHDGKHGRCNCGYGYTWNDDDYVGRGGGSSGGGKIPSSVLWAAQHPFQGGGFTPK